MNYIPRFGKNQFLPVALYLYNTTPHKLTVTQISHNNKYHGNIMKTTVTGQSDPLKHQADTKILLTADWLLAPGDTRQQS